MPDRYAVIGHPIAHSKSPRIHRLFAQQTGQDIEYDALLAPLEGFRDTVAQFVLAGGCGANVTVPFKREAWAMVSRRTVRADRAGAVNTMTFHRSGESEGDNTDGVGLLRDLLINNQLKLHDATIVLIGAGGAARGVIGPLIEAKPKRLVIANRDPARANDLAATFADLGAVSACGLTDIPESVDLMINATSASLAGESLSLPECSIGSQTVCYDMMYAKDPTPFMRWGQSLGAYRQIDGLGMLVEQAAEAFHIWRGVHPETGPVISQLRRELAI